MTASKVAVIVTVLMLLLVGWIVWLDDRTPDSSNGYWADRDSRIVEFERHVDRLNIDGDWLAEGQVFCSQVADHQSPLMVGLTIQVHTEGLVADGLTNRQATQVLAGAASYLCPDEADRISRLAEEVNQ